MLTATLLLDDASGDEVTYALVSQSADGSIRRDTATTNAEPGLLAIRHSRSGKGTNVIDRHLVQLTRAFQDDNGVSRVATVNLTLAVPQTAEVTNAVIIDMVSNLIDLIADGSFSSSGIGGTTVLTQLLRGES